MVNCLIRITLPDGQLGSHHGLFACTVDAVIHALELFPLARKISVEAHPA